MKKSEIIELTPAYYNQSSFGVQNWTSTESKNRTRERDGVSFRIENFRYGGQA